MEIDSKLEHVTALRYLACKVNHTFSETPPSGTPDPKRMENVIVRFVDLEKEVDETIDRLVDIKGSIMKAIRKLDDPKERIVLELRYLAFKRLAGDCRENEAAAPPCVPDPPGCSGTP